MRIPFSFWGGANLSLNDMLFGVWNGNSTSNTLDTTLYSAYNTNGSAVDSYSGNNGTFSSTGETYNIGKVGKSFSFSGASYVALPNNTHTFSGDFTISMWVYLTSLPSTAKLISTYTTSGVQNGYTLSVNAAGGVSFNGWSGGVSISTLTSSNGSVTTSTWVHLTLVYKSGVGSYLYKNGALLTSGTASAPIGYYSTVYPTIGANKYTSVLVDGYVNGYINTVTTWSRALVLDDVYQLYNVGNGTSYPFSNKVLPTLNDNYGSNNITAVNGAVLSTSGKINQSFTFDGVDDYFQLPNNSLNFTGDFTINFWMNLQGVGSDKQAPICNNQINYAGTQFWGWSTYIQNSQLDFIVNIGDASEVRLSANIGAYYNTWTMFTITRKASTGTKIYANGSLIASNTSTVNPAYTTTHTPTIGCWKTTYSTPLLYFMKSGGKIDGLSMWTRVLDTTDITTLYDGTYGLEYNFNTPTYDTDAVIFNNTIGLTSTSQKNAVNYLFTNLKSEGLYTKLVAGYPFVGGTSAQHKFNMKNPLDTDAAYRLTFNGGITHNSSGVTPNGTNGYAWTYLAQSAFTQNSQTVVEYITNTVANSVVLRYNVGAGLTYTLPRYFDTVYNRIQYGSGSNLGYSNTETKGLYVHNRTNSTQISGFKNAGFKQTVSETSANPIAIARTFLLFANDNGTGPALTPDPAYYGPFASAGIFFFTGLTDDETVKLSTIINTYQGMLGRNVY